MENPNPDQERQSTCPYLGFANDPSTAMAFPALENSCHRISPPRSPNSVHQRLHCLSDNHTTCEVFAGTNAKAIPREIFPRQKRTLPRIKGNHILAALLVVAIVVVAYQLISSGVLQLIFRSNQAVPPVMVAYTPVIETLLETPTATATTAPTLTPLPTVFVPTPTLPPPLQIGTPVGLERKFLVHQVLPGESLELIAELYFTTSNAIRAINDNLPAALWVDTLLVIPYDQQSVPGVTPMKPYLVDREDLTVETLAALLGVDAQALRDLNQLPEGYPFTVGSYVLVPVR